MTLLLLVADYLVNVSPLYCDEALSCDPSPLSFAVSLTFASPRRRRRSCVARPTVSAWPKRKREPKNFCSARWRLLSFPLRMLRCDRCHLWKIKIYLATSHHFRMRNMTAAAAQPWRLGNSVCIIYSLASTTCRDIRLKAHSHTKFIINKL